MTLTRIHDYEIDDEASRIDPDAVWSFLSTEAYWHRWRTRSEVEAQLRSAWRIVGAYHGDEQVGFARAVSDGVAVAYLADVYVLAAHRGRGLGEAIVRTMIDGGAGRGFRWMLHTADAHELYRRVGFAAAPPTFMERPGAHPPTASDGAEQG